MTTTSPEPQATPPTPPGSAPATPSAGSFSPPPTFTAPVIPVRRRASLLTTALLVGAAAVAVAGISFAVGRVTAPASAVAAANGRQFPGLGNGGANGANGGNGGGTFRGGFGGVGIRGTVTAVDGSTITVKLANGQEIKVQTDSSTTYHQQTSGSASDVASGKSVIVQIQPGSGGFGGGGGTGTTGAIKASDITVTGG
ncbi:MAG: DUF5666 domain-containing protein [Chloroflexota bacterium]|nr:DUF5666 domain-containing protein [Chloroflexota bacterium]